MNILHIAEHMGDGVGKAIGGLARLGCKGGDTHRILLLDTPTKRNHIDRCINDGVEVIECTSSEEMRHCGPRAAIPFGEVPIIIDAIAKADIVILNWWGGKVMDRLIKGFPKVPCRLLLWAHKNGYYDPPLPDSLVDMCDGLLVTTPWTLENPKWREKGTLVWGFGDFDAKTVPVKTDYSIERGIFKVGYVGLPGYKRFPSDASEYFKEAIRQVPDCRFMLAGENDDKFIDDIEAAGLGGYVTFLGWTPGIDDLLTGFDVFGYITKSDIFGTTENSIIEAMASGLPIAMSRRPLGRFFVENEGITGFLFDSPEEYGGIIKRLYYDEALRQQTGENAREYVLTTRRRDDNMERFDEVCKRVMRTGKVCRVYE